MRPIFAMSHGSSPRSMLVGLLFSKRQKERFNTENKWIFQRIWFVRSERPFAAHVNNDWTEPVELRRPCKAHAINFIPLQKFDPKFEFACIYHRSTNGIGIYVIYLCVSHQNKLIIDFMRHIRALSVPLSHLLTTVGYAIWITNNGKIIFIFIWRRFGSHTLRCDEFVTVSDSNKLHKLEALRCFSECIALSERILLDQKSKTF